VQAAAIGTIIPYGIVSNGRMVRRDGPALPADAKPATAAEGRAYSGSWNSIGADYFTAMNLPVKKGRTFSAAESTQPGAPRVVVIDEVLARQLWPDGDALGQFVRFTGERDAIVGAMQVVGIVGTTQTEYFSDEIGGAVYVPFAQGYASNVHFHVRPAMDTEAAALALVPVVREVLREAAAGVPVFKVRTFKQHAEVGLGSMLLIIFSGFAMFVAVVGIYSVKAYQVSRRTREIGIRMALGALPGTVQALILREGLATASVGIAAGLLLGLGLNRLFSSVLVGVKAFDPVVLLAAATVFFLAATVASWLPARKATRVNPLEALRSE
jgi:hypothetical protein